MMNNTWSTGTQPTFQTGTSGTLPPAPQTNQQMTFAQIPQQYGPHPAVYPTDSVHTTYDSGAPQDAGAYQQTGQMGSPVPAANPINQGTNPYGPIAETQATGTYQPLPQTGLPTGIPQNGTAGQQWTDPATGNVWQYYQTLGWMNNTGDPKNPNQIPTPIPGPGTPNQNPGDGPVPTSWPTNGNWPTGSAGTGTQPPPYSGGIPDIDPYVFPNSPTQQATGVGGVSAVNPQAGAFDYGQVSDFADSAWNQAKRYLDPQFELQDRRFEQSLINKGIDPNSEAGQRAFQQKSMGQNDLLSKSAFDALGFGAGIQDQMFGQSATRSGLSSQLLQAMMGLNQRGHEFDVTAGLNANQQAFAQMLALEGLDYRDYMTLIDQMRYDDSLALSLLGMGAPPGYTTVNTGFASAPYADLNNSQYMWNTPLFGSS